MKDKFSQNKFFPSRKKPWVINSIFNIKKNKLNGNYFLFISFLLVSPQKNIISYAIKNFLNESVFFRDL